MWFNGFCDIGSLVELIGAERFQPDFRIS